MTRSEFLAIVVVCTVLLVPLTFGQTTIVSGETGVSPTRSVQPGGTLIVHSCTFTGTLTIAPTSASTAFTGTIAVYNNRVRKMLIQNFWCTDCNITIVNNVLDSSAGSSIKLDPGTAFGTTTTSAYVRIASNYIDTSAGFLGSTKGIDLDFGSISTGTIIVEDNYVRIRAGLGSNHGAIVMVATGLADAAIVRIEGNRINTDTMGDVIAVPTTSSGSARLELRENKIAFVSLAALAFGAGQLLAPSRYRVVDSSAQSIIGYSTNAWASTNKIVMDCNEVIENYFIARFPSGWKQTASIFTSEGDCQAQSITQALPTPAPPTTTAAPPTTTAAPPTTTAAPPTTTAAPPTTTAAAPPTTGLVPSVPTTPVPTTAAPPSSQKPTQSGTLSVTRSADRSRTASLGRTGSLTATKSASRSSTLSAASPTQTVAASETMSAPISASGESGSTSSSQSLKGARIVVLNESVIPANSIFQGRDGAFERILLLIVGDHFSSEVFPTPAGDPSSSAAAAEPVFVEVKRCVRLLTSSSSSNITVNATASSAEARAAYLDTLTGLIMTIALGLLPASSIKAVDRLDYYLLRNATMVATSPYRAELWLPHDVPFTFTMDFPLSVEMDQRCFNQRVAPEPFTITMLASQTNPPAPVRSIVPQSVVETSKVAGEVATGASAVGGGLTAAQLSRSQLILGLRSCTVSEQQLDPSEAPMGVAIGSSTIAYYVGGNLNHLVIVFFVAAQMLVALVYALVHQNDFDDDATDQSDVSCHSDDENDDVMLEALLNGVDAASPKETKVPTSRFAKAFRAGLGLVRFPSLLAFPVMLLLEPTTMCTVVTLIYGTTQERIGAAFSAACLLAYPAVAFKLMEAPRFHAVYHSDWERHQMQLQQESCKSGEGAELHVPFSFRRAVEHFFFGAAKWTDAPAHKGFCQRTRLFYCDYIGRWRRFIVGEMLMCIACGIIDGMRLGVGQCNGVLIGLLVVISVYLLVVLVCRPFNSWFLLAFCVVLTTLQLLGAIFLAIADFGGHEEAVEYAEWTSVIAMWLLLIRTIFDLSPKLYRFYKGVVSALRRRRKRELDKDAGSVAMRRFAVPLLVAPGDADDDTDADAENRACREALEDEELADVLEGSAEVEPADVRIGFGLMDRLDDDAESETESCSEDEVIAGPSTRRFLPGANVSHDVAILAAANHDASAAIDADFEALLRAAEAAERGEVCSGFDNAAIIEKLDTLNEEQHLLLVLTSLKRPELRIRNGRNRATDATISLLEAFVATLKPSDWGPATTEAELSRRAARDARLVTIVTEISGVEATVLKQKIFRRQADEMIRREEEEARRRRESKCRYGGSAAVIDAQLAAMLDGIDDPQPVSAESRETGEIPVKLALPQRELQLGIPPHAADESSDEHRSNGTADDVDDDNDDENDTVPSCRDEVAECQGVKSTSHSFSSLALEDDEATLNEILGDD